MTLDVVAVERFTQGRLGRDDVETQNRLDVALAAARHWCGWHVLPVRQETVLLDGPGGRLLTLPTLRVVSIEGVAECGTVIDPDMLSWSVNGRVVKRDVARDQIPTLQRSQGNLAWTDEFRGIEVTFTHGFDSALDFENVILAAVDRGIASATSGAIKAIGPFHYNTTFGAEAGPSFMEQEVAVLDRYRLEKPA